MLSEKQIYEAKVFLRSYKDALLCLEQTVVKKITFSQYRDKYADILLGEKNEETQKLFRFSQ